MADASPAVDDDFASRLLSRIKSVVYDDPEQAALDLAAFQYLAQGAAQIDLRAPSLDDVGLLLRRLPSGLRRWTWDDQKKTPNSTAQKWAVENEYHFQNLLCVVLAPVVPDLRDEEWLASVGQKKPRADLVIPSLHLVIEVKYWRTKSSPQDLISQIGEDVSLYLKRGSPYTPQLLAMGRERKQLAIDRAEREVAVAQRRIADAVEFQNDPNAANNQFSSQRGQRSAEEYQQLIDGMLSWKDRYYAAIAELEAREMSRAQELLKAELDKKLQMKVSFLVNKKFSVAPQTANWIYEGRQPEPVNLIYFAAALLDPKRLQEAMMVKRRNQLTFYPDSAKVLEAFPITCGEKVSAGCELRTAKP